MTTLHEAAKMALDALEAMQMEAQARKCGLKIADDAITALREALTAPMPEPVAWRIKPMVSQSFWQLSDDGYYASCKRDQGYIVENLYAAPPAAPAPATSADYAMGYAEGFNDACKPAPVVREPIIDEMDAVASKYAHKLALDLECVLSDYNGKWWDTAMQTIGGYRSAMNAIHERESPTHMGEPVLPKHGIGDAANE